MRAGSGQPGRMTPIWFVIWFVADRIGDRASLALDPVNTWTWTLMLAVAVDLGRQHTPARARRPRRP
jgi:hypothetical protein